MKKIILYFDPSAKKILIDKTDEAGKKTKVLSSPKNFVSASEIVARIVEIDDVDQIPQRIDPEYDYYKVVDYIPVKCGEGIYFDERLNAYKAEAYGFVVIINGEFRLLTARFITRDKFKAYYYLHPTKFNKLPSYNDIEEYMHNFKILAGIGKKKIEEQLAKIDVQNPKLTRILVAKGKEPVNGHEEYFVPFMDFGKKAGQLKADGSIDFKELNSIVQVKKGQEILERIPEVKSVDGYDIFGDNVSAQFEDGLGFKRGDNIVQSGHDENIYLAALDGCLKEIKKKVHILETVVINGDVNYETGNIEFSGTVIVNGSVLPGFSVKADADIVIEGTVDDAQILAGGNVSVKLGVVGKESVKVVAGGQVSAKYLLNAHIEAGGEVNIEDSIINCQIFTNKKISVLEKQGKIIGGNCTALNEIEAKVAGAPNETATVLTVGRNLFIEREVYRIKKLIAGSREDVAEITRRLKVNFGDGVFEDPKKYLSILPDVKKKNCLILLKELSESNKKLKELQSDIEEVESKLKLDQEPVIIIHDKIYPGTVLNIKKSVRKIDKEAVNVKFYEEPEEKIIRFTSAN